MKLEHLALSSLLLVGCAAARPPAAIPMAALAAEAPAAAPSPLVEDHFLRDRGGSVSPEALATILAAPTYLDEAARIGILPVSTGYGVDPDVPVATPPGVLGAKLEASGLFEGVSEVSTDFPSDGSLAGLRELAARYRAEYLLLYRHRFLDDEYANPWAASYLALVTIPFVPGTTLEVNGVVEATLLDVRSGTLLFSAFERIHARSTENVWQQGRKRRELKEALLADASVKLSDQVMSKLRRLVAARPSPSSGLASEGRDHARVDGQLVVEVGEVPQLAR